MCNGAGAADAAGAAADRSARLNADRQAARQLNLRAADAAGNAGNPTKASGVPQGQADVAPPQGDILDILKQLFQPKAAAQSPVNNDLGTALQALFSSSF
jgi:hypothetical protein